MTLYLKNEINSVHPEKKDFLFSKIDFIKRENS